MKSPRERVRTGRNTASDAAQRNGKTVEYAEAVRKVRRLVSIPGPGPATEACRGTGATGYYGRPMASGWSPGLPLGFVEAHTAALHATAACRAAQGLLAKAVLQEKAEVCVQAFLSSCLRACTVAVCASGSTQQ